jgi:hypothetical protein
MRDRIEMPSWFGRRGAAIPVAVVVAALAATGAMAFAAGGNGSGLHPTPVMGGAGPVQGVPTVEAAAFAILRRPLTAADQVPQGGALADDLGLGANTSLARRADSGEGTARWVIPAMSDVCLTAELGGAFHATCASLSDASAGNEMLTITGGPGRAPDETTVLALAPDDVAGATLELRDGSTRSLSIVGNTIDATVAGEPIAIQWRTVAGAVRRAVVAAQ